MIFTKKQHNKQNTVYKKIELLKKLKNINLNVKHNCIATKKRLNYTAYDKIVEIGPNCSYVLFVGTKSIVVTDYYRLKNAG